MNGESALKFRTPGGTVAEIVGRSLQQEEGREGTGMTGGVTERAS
jgi:hypothetical protein